MFDLHYRLELLTNNPKEERAKFHSSIEDDNFAVGLINEVVKAFLAAPESRMQVITDRFHSVQETPDRFHHVQVTK